MSTYDAPVASRSDVGFLGFDGWPQMSELVRDGDQFAEVARVQTNATPPQRRRGTVGLRTPTLTAAIVTFSFIDWKPKPEMDAVLSNLPDGTALESSNQTSSHKMPVA
jgi:hypothetical protein